MRTALRRTMSNASIDRLFDYANKHCPKCIRVLPPIRLTGKREFRVYWWYEQFEQVCECGFERGGWRKVHVSNLIRPTQRALDGANGAASKAECEDCGLPYNDFMLDVTLPDEQWLAIHPSGINGLLCARCIVARASKLKNIVAVRAVLDDGTPRK